MSTKRLKTSVILQVFPKDPIQAIKPNGIALQLQKSSPTKNRSSLRKNGF
ncbi:hypothetical protein SAMN05421761_105170 [Belliella pelovolcani]|uniref:Uncharacterized protein n=1 Tax=Belliella pelovolcani TaxID=529505 RepID=A0A1N7M7Q7_9BACT|nr:hypothetical protein SAMN05421761_105170 [Belliella pelovolcani]